MGFSDDFWRAVARYRVTFPTFASLGADYATWLAELERVQGTSQAQVLITSASQEGGNQSGERNFQGGLLEDALHCRRYELEPDDYELPEHLAGFPTAKTDRRARVGGTTFYQFSP